MTLVEYVSDQTVPQSADCLPWRPRVPLELPRSLWEGTRGSQGGQYAVSPPDTSPEQPYFYLAYTLGSTSHESTFEDMVLTQTPSFAAGKDSGILAQSTF